MSVEFKFNRGLPGNTIAEFSQCLQLDENEFIAVVIPYVIHGSQIKGLNFEAHMHKNESKCALTDGKFRSTWHMGSNIRINEARMCSN